jgi:hypothetical protein
MVLPGFCGACCRYYVQHLSLIVTSFVFTMGLLFKVRVPSRLPVPAPCLPAKVHVLRPPRTTPNTPSHPLPCDQVKGVSQSEGVFAALAAIMLLACLAFGVTWVGCMVLGVMETMRRRRIVRLVTKAHMDRRSSQPDSSDEDGEAEGAALVGDTPVRDVLNPLQRARRMLGTGVSSRFTVPRESPSAAGQASPALGGVPVVLLTNPMQRARRLLGAGVGVSSRLVVAGPAQPPPPPPPQGVNADRVAGSEWGRR